MDTTSKNIQALVSTHKRKLREAYYGGVQDERARLRRRAQSEGLAFVLTGAAVALVGRTVCDVLRDYPRTARVALGWAFAAWWTKHIWDGKDDD